MGFKGPRNMTVLLPGMTEDDQRVKISSCDTTQQGLLDSWKTKVLLLIFSGSKWKLCVFQLIHLN